MDSLAELVTKLYQVHEIHVEPTYPRVLVRVLPREQVTKGGIVLPEHRQNKPNLEGVVLSTYRPFWKMVVKSDRENWERNRAQIQIEVLDGGHVEKSVVRIESPVKPGDHIAFPHMAIGITPVWNLDGGKGDYRLVPDDQILGVLTYEQESIKEWLLKVVDLSEGLREEVVENILAKADVVRKDVKARAMSGV